MQASISPQKNFFTRLRIPGWTRHSSILLGAFFLTCGMILYFWWPLAKEVLATVNWEGEWWKTMDWLLIGIFGFMTLTILYGADLKRDLRIILVGAIGGLVIETWGTQTNLWHYFTAERPPLWIIPAWPIASLSIDRITRFLSSGISRIKRRTGWNFNPTLTQVLYWLVFSAFFLSMLQFTAPTLHKSMTLMALTMVGFLILTPGEHGYAILVFMAGTSLGLFLEVWGTTRQCWTYYTLQTPPFFAILAHGMAALAFWRGGRLVQAIWNRIKGTLPGSWSIKISPKETEKSSDNLQTQGNSS